MAKMSRALRRYEQNLEYFERLREIIDEITVRTSVWGHPCFKINAKGRTTFLVVSADKEFVGDLNNKILEFADRKIAECDDPLIISVGAAAKEHFVKIGCTVKDDFCDVAYDPEPDDADDISEYLFSEFMSEKTGEIYMIYTEYKSQNDMSPGMLKLLPLLKDDMVSSDAMKNKDGYITELFYEPSPQEVLNIVIPQYLSGMIYGGLLQSSVAEHFCRRLSMNSATRNADKIIADLKSEYNRARQSSVTSEITEIAAAVSGVKK